MYILHAVNILKKMDWLIRTKATGKQKEFAQKIGVHRSTLNDYLNDIKLLGFPVSYCHKRRSYYYAEEGKLVGSLFERKKLSDEEMRKISGGVQILWSVKKNINQAFA